MITLYMPPTTQYIPVTSSMPAPYHSSEKFHGKKGRVNSPMPRKA